MRENFIIFSRKSGISYDRKDRELINHGGSVNYETEIVLNSGEKFYVIINKSVFADHEYGGAFVVGVITDITGRKNGRAASDHLDGF